jgi:hypothetical protein
MTDEGSKMETVASAELKALHHRKKTEYYEELIEILQKKDDEDE